MSYGIDWETVEIDSGFEAVHYGTCGDCGESIIPGEMIRQAVGGHYEHVKCDRDVDAEADAAPVEVCPDCHLEHAGGCF